MKVLSVEEMRNLDNKAIKGLGIPGVILMENAGLGVVEMMDDMIGVENISSAFVVSGKGNNGGDGFVVARILHDYGIDVNVLLLGEKKDIKGDALINMKIVENLGVPVYEVKNRSRRWIRNMMEGADVVVDAIFGTGFKGSPEGVFLNIIQDINMYGRIVFSIDVPSGVNADTGEVQGEAVFADATCTMGLIKRGLLLFPARYFVGELYVADIGIPEVLIEEGDYKTELLEDDVVAPLIPLRFPYSHKGIYGKVGIFAGSRGFTGAACLTSESALRAGAGLVYILSPASLVPLYETKLTEVIKIPLNGDTDYYTSSMLDQALGMISDFDAIIIGPGIGRNKETKRFVKSLLKEWDGLCVIDADGLNNIELEDLKNSKGRWILTPHPGEFSRLTGKSISEIEGNRVGSATSFAKEHNVILVLKGVPTIIASPSGDTYINPTGNSGLASGGSGDVLTGLIGGFLTQSKDPISSAVAGVYIHGKAADIALEEGESEHSLIAGDLLYFIGDAINDVLEEE